jgi:Putative beta-barrel porin-2, OmpL-like. bbp2
MVNYVTWTFTPRLSGTARVELFDDARGQRTGFEGLYTAVTAGLSFKPVKMLNLRPEIRYDYNSQSRPFEDKHGLFTASMDVILRW